MLSLLVYLVACAFVSVIISTVYLAFRPMKNIDEQVKPWTIMLILFLLTLGAPYGFVEAQTKKHKSELATAVNDAFNRSDVKGGIKYWKIVSFSESKAKVLIVGEEDNDVSGKEHPVVSVELSKGKDGWNAESYAVLASTRLNQDRLVLPPYF